MSSLAAVTIGQRARIEGRTGRATMQRLEAIARAEDRYRVLDADTVLDVPRESAHELLRSASEQQWTLGDIVVRSESPWVFDLVVYDLDATPIVQIATVSDTLLTLMDTLCRHQISNLALEPIGMAHGGISARAFARALVHACHQGPLGLRVVICEQDRRVLERIMAACTEAAGPDLAGPLTS